MKTSILLFLSLVVCGYGFAMLGPWWFPIIPCLVISAWWAGGRKRFVSKRANREYSHVQYPLSASAAFLISGFALMTIWLLYGWFRYQADATGLTSKIGSLFTISIPALAQLPAEGLVFALIGLVAFLLGGFAGMAGVRLRR